VEEESFKKKAVGDSSRKMWKDLEIRRSQVILAIAIAMAVEPELVCEGKQRCGSTR
jgi:hypothetical protein